MSAWRRRILHKRRKRTLHTSRRRKLRTRTGRILRSWTRRIQRQGGGEYCVEEEENIVHNRRRILCIRGGNIAYKRR